MHVQQRLLKEEWPMRLGDHAAARVVTAGDLEDDPINRQTIFNGLRVRMAVNTGTCASLTCISILSQCIFLFQPFLQHKVCLAFLRKGRMWGWKWGMCG